MNKEEEINKSFNLKFSRKTDLELLRECMTSVMNFVHSDSEYQQPEFQMDLNFEKPNYKRQKILREQGFLDLLSHSHPRKALRWNRNLKKEAANELVNVQLLALCVGFKTPVYEYHRKDAMSRL